MDSPSDLCPYPEMSGWHVCSTVQQDIRGSSEACLACHAACPPTPHTSCFVQHHFPKPNTNCVLFASALTLRVCSDVSHKCQIFRSPTLPSPTTLPQAWGLSEVRRGSPLRLLVSSNGFIPGATRWRVLRAGCVGTLPFTGTPPSHHPEHSPTQSVQILLGRVSEPSLQVSDWD